MKLAFIIDITLDYGIMGSLIEEAFYNGHEIHCLHHYNERLKKIPEKYLFPHIEKSPTFQRKINLKKISFVDEGDLHGLIQKNKYDCIISIRTPSRVIKKTKIVNLPFWVTIQYVFDTFELNDLDSLNSADRILCYGMEWIELLKMQWEHHLEEKEFREVYNEVVKKVRIVGLSQVDPIKIIDRSAIKKKLKIPSEKKVVLLIGDAWGFHKSYNIIKNLPFVFYKIAQAGNISNIRKVKLFSSKVIGLYFAKRKFYNVYKNNLGKRIKGLKTNLSMSCKTYDKAFAYSISQFCKNNDAILIIKTREKIPIPSYLSKYGDLVINNYQYYPSTIIELLSISNLLISANNTSAILESVVCNVPSINISIDNPHDSVYYDKSVSKIFDYEKVVFSLTKNEFIEKLPRSNIDDFRINKENRNKYINKYLGYDDYNSGKRAINIIENSI